MGRVSVSRKVLRHAGIACLSILCAIDAAAGQSPQDAPDPVILADGAFTVGGNASITIGPGDPGFFNYTDYEYSELRMLRLELAAALRAGSHVSMLGEIRSQNTFGFRPASLDVHAPQVYALYLRVRPWTGRRFDVQIGRVPPTFGAFPRRSYESDNPLIGYPLAYQYLTSLRADAVPKSADELLQMRGRGWLATYSTGNLTPGPGVPLANAFRWDTGVQAHAASDIVELTGSVTIGSLSNPLFTDDNSGRQIAGRVALHPVAGLIAGASVARGPFVSGDAARAAVGGEQDGAFVQTAWGADVEYSRGYYLLRAETVISRWTIPALGSPALSGPLRASAISAEGRYKIRPGLYAAARADHLSFAEITGAEERATWDAPVTRIEVGGGYSIRRNLLLKVSGQFNKRDGGRVRRARLGAAQLVFWF
jgi:hypothetical protein